tara:strand:- start:639 stop:1034 length:396 start_codon:yes stop_codon:yes gene_type:complete
MAQSETLKFEILPSTNPATYETLLVHGGDSTTTTRTSEVYKGDGYYGRSDGFHTVQYTLTGFVGTVKLQATLAVEPTVDDWFEVYSETYAVVDDEGISGSYITNFTGNYVWIRAYISEWTDGAVNSIILNH